MLMVPHHLLVFKFVKPYKNNSMLTFIQPMFPYGNLNFFRVLDCTEDVLHESFS